jgi:hypothetical protein
MTIEPVRSFNADPAPLDLFMAQLGNFLLAELPITSV